MLSLCALCWVTMHISHAIVFVLVQRHPVCAYIGMAGCSLFLFPSFSLSLSLSRECLHYSVCDAEVHLLQCRSLQNELLLCCDADAVMNTAMMIHSCAVYG